MANRICTDCGKPIVDMPPSVIVCRECWDIEAESIRVLEDELIRLIENDIKDVRRK